MLQSKDAICWAAGFALFGIAVSLYQILCHLRNYTEPVFQRYIIRIIFMVPVYAIGSVASLIWREHAIYYDTMRDCYEAWIIYNFSSLLLAYVGGPGAVVVKAEGKLVHPSWTHMTCCLPTMQVDGFFLRRCKQGTLQFVLLKPFMALLTVILYAAGAYTDGDMSPGNGYFYISIMYNVCYTFALYGLMLFWIGASELLQPFNPLLKFALVKSVVFLTFWQGIAISYINSMGEISDPEDGKALQNFMICVEMAIAGVSLLYAFPHKEYQIGGSTSAWRISAFVHAISIRDVVSDTIHVFAPSYSDYVLYTDGGPADNVKRKKYRGQKGTTNGEHPKAGLIKNVEKGVLADDDDEPGGGRSKTPLGEKSMKKREAHRQQAVLLDSDSDGIDSEDDGPQLGTEIAAALDGHDDNDELALRHARLTTTDNDAGEPESGLNSVAASRRTTQQPSYSRGGISRGFTRSSQSTVGRAGAEETAVKAPTTMRMPVRGPILSDSESDDDAVCGYGASSTAGGGGAVAPAVMPAASTAGSCGLNKQGQPQQQEQQQSDVAASNFVTSSNQVPIGTSSSSSSSTGSAISAAGNSPMKPQEAAGVQAAAAAAAMMAKKRGAHAAAAAAAGLAAAAQGVQRLAHAPAVSAAARPALAPPKKPAGAPVAHAAATTWEADFPEQQHSGQQEQGGGWADSEQGWSNVKL